MRRKDDPSYSNHVISISGEGAIKRLPHIVEKLGSTHPLVIISKGAADNGAEIILFAGWKDRNSSSPIPLPSSVVPLSSREIHRGTVAILMDRYEKGGHDAIVAAGGGAVMDIAKVLRLTLQKADHSYRLREGYMMEGFPKHVPLVLVPTTIGSGSGASKVAYMFDREQERTLRFEHHFMYPDVTILDSRLMKSVSPLQTAFGVAAILGRAVESITSPFVNTVSESFALQAIRLLVEHSFRVVHTPHDLEARMGIAVASLAAGYAFDTTQGGLAHAASIVLERLKGIPYGQCMMILLPLTLVYNMDGSESAFLKITKVVAADDTNFHGEASLSEHLGIMVIEWVKNHFEMLTKSLSHQASERFHDLVGLDGKSPPIHPEEFEYLAEAIHNSVDVLTNRNVVGIQDIIRVLEAAYWGYPLDRAMIPHQSSTNGKRKTLWNGSLLSLSRKS